MFYKKKFEKLFNSVFSLSIEHVKLADKYTDLCNENIKLIVENSRLKITNADYDTALSLHVLIEDVYGRNIGMSAWRIDELPGIISDFFKKIHALEYEIQELKKEPPNEN